MMKRSVIENIIKEGFLTGTAEKQRKLQAILQQVQQLGEEVPESEYQKVLEIIRGK